MLDALTRDRIELEVHEREMNVPTVQRTDDLEKDELSEARRELQDFRKALADARSRAGGDGGAEVAYDSRDSQQNAAADVLIQYLVRPGYAEVRTEEPEAEHYVYFIRVDWPKLRALAHAQGHPIAL